MPWLMFQSDGHFETSMLNPEGPTYRFLLFGSWPYLPVPAAGIIGPSAPSRRPAARRRSSLGPYWAPMSRPPRSPPRPGLSSPSNPLLLSPPHARGHETDGDEQRRRHDPPMLLHSLPLVVAGEVTVEHTAEPVRAAALRMRHRTNPPATPFDAGVPRCRRLGERNRSRRDTSPVKELQHLAHSRPITLLLRARNVVVFGKEGG